MTEPMTLAQLWGASPSTPDLPPDLKREPGPLTLHLPPYPQVIQFSTDEGRIELAIEGISPDLSDESVATTLRSYPTLAGGRPVRDSLGKTPDRGRYYNSDNPTHQITYSTDARAIDLDGFSPWIRNSPVLSWPLKDSDDEPYRASYEALAPVEVDGRSDRRIAFPAIGGSDRPGFLSLWWALLLALSSLVRYEPALWTASIDADRSTMAVPLEQACDFAEVFVPTILRSALTRDA